MSMDGHSCFASFVVVIGRLSILDFGITSRSASTVVLRLATTAHDAIVVGLTSASLTHARLSALYDHSDRRHRHHGGE